MAGDGGCPMSHPSAASATTAISLAPLLQNRRPVLQAGAAPTCIPAPPRPHTRRRPVLQTPCRRPPRSPPHFAPLPRLRAPAALPSPPRIPNLAAASPLGLALPSRPTAVSDCLAACVGRVRGGGGGGEPGGGRGGGGGEGRDRGAAPARELVVGYALSSKKPKSFLQPKLRGLARVCDVRRRQSLPPSLGGCESSPSKSRGALESLSNRQLDQRTPAPSLHPDLDRSLGPQEVCGALCKFQSAC